MARIATGSLSQNLLLMRLLLLLLVLVLVLVIFPESDANPQE
jgi:hypothetical protein